MKKSLTLSLNPAMLEVQAGDEAQTQLTFRNHSSTVAHYQVRVQDIDRTWYTAQPEQVGLFPDQEASITLRLHPPHDAPPDNYLVILALISQEDTPSEEWAVLDLKVRASRPVSAPTPMLDPSTAAPIHATLSDNGQLELSADRNTQNITLAAGSQADINLTLRNHSGSPLSLQLTALGLPVNWLSLTPSSIVLPPNQSETAILSLTPAADAPSASYPLMVSTQTYEEPPITVQLGLVLEIGAPNQLTVDLQPSQAKGYTTAQFTVQVGQNGSTPLRVNLSARDEGACDYTFEPSTLTLHSTVTVTSQLTVRVRQQPTNSEEHVYPFTVIATAVEGANGTAQGRFIQRPAPPIDLHLTPSQQIAPDKAVLTVRITNPSDSPETFHLSATDSTAACRYEFIPPSINIPPKKTAQATLTVTPNQYHSQKHNKSHPFIIHARVASELLPSAQVSGEYVQSAMEQPQLTLEPNSQSTTNKATFTLQVSNPRPIPLDIELQPTDPNGACEFRVKPQRLNLSPGAQGRAQLLVRPTMKLLPGETRRTHQFVVEGHAKDMAQPTIVKGTLIQIPGKSLWIWLLQGIIGLLFCLIMLFVGVLIQDWLNQELLPTPTSTQVIAAPATVALIISPTMLSSPTPPPAEPPPSPPTERPPTPTETPPPPTEAPPPTPSEPRIIGFAACSGECQEDRSNAARSFPQSTTHIQTVWNYENIPEGSSYVREWTVDGGLYVKYECSWNGPQTGAETKVTLNAAEEPLPSGTWLITVTVNGELLLGEEIRVEGTNPSRTLTTPVIDRCHE